MWWGVSKKSESYGFEPCQQKSKKWRSNDIDNILVQEIRVQRLKEKTWEIIEK